MATNRDKVRALARRLRPRRDPGLERRVQELERRTTTIEFGLRRHAEAVERLELLTQDLVSASASLRRRIEDDR